MARGRPRRAATRKKSPVPTETTTTEAEETELSSATTATRRSARTASKKQKPADTKKKTQAAKPMRASTRRRRKREETEDEELKEEEEEEEEQQEEEELSEEEAPDATADEQSSDAEEQGEKSKSSDANLAEKSSRRRKKTEKIEEGSESQEEADGGSDVASDERDTKDDIDERSSQAEEESKTSDTTEQRVRSSTRSQTRPRTEKGKQEPSLHEESDGNAASVEETEEASLRKADAHEDVDETRGSPSMQKGAEVQVPAVTEKEQEEETTEQSASKPVDAVKITKRDEKEPDKHAQPADTDKKDKPRKDDMEIATESGEPVEDAENEEKQERPKSVAVQEKGESDAANKRYCAMPSNNNECCGKEGPDIGETEENAEQSKPTGMADKPSCKGEVSRNSAESHKRLLSADGTVEAAQGVQETAELVKPETDVSQDGKERSQSRGTVKNTATDDVKSTQVGGEDVIRPSAKAVETATTEADRMNKGKESSEQKHWDESGGREIREIRADAQFKGKPLGTALNFGDEIATTTVDEPMSAKANEPEAVSNIGEGREKSADESMPKEPDEPLENIVGRKEIRENEFSTISAVKSDTEKEEIQRSAAYLESKKGLGATSRDDERRNIAALEEAYVGAKSELPDREKPSNARPLVNGDETGNVFSSKRPMSSKPLEPEARGVTRISALTSDSTHVDVAVDLRDDEMKACSESSAPNKRSKKVEASELKLVEQRGVAKKGGVFHPAGEVGPKQTQSADSLHAERQDRTDNVSEQLQAIVKEDRGAPATLPSSSERTLVAPLERKPSIEMDEDALDFSVNKGEEASHDIDERAAKKENHLPVKEEVRAVGTVEEAPLPDRKRRREDILSPTEGSPISVDVPKVKRRRLNLERIKMLLFSSGSLVHGCRNYEKVFAEYWAALSRRLEGRLSEVEGRKCRLVLDSFLKTKKLRKLHNKLIMGLLERCMLPACLSRDLSYPIPVSWHSRVKLLSKDAIAETRKARAVAKTKRITASPTYIVDASTSSGDYTPLFSEPVERLVEVQDLPTKTSFTIPGAIAIDPYVRTLAQASGMKVSENAIWLLVVAMQEYSNSLVKSTIASMKAIEQGQAPSSPLLRTRALAKKRGSVPATADNAPKNGPATENGETKCITVLDLHHLTASMPIGHARSIGGSVSRPAFEQSLFASFNSNIVSGGKAFEDVHDFIVSRIAPPLPKRRRIEPSQPLSISEELQIAKAAATLGRKSPHGGLGKGAKDLAALIARSSSTVKNPVEGSVATAAAAAAQIDSQAPGIADKASAALAEVAAAAVAAANMTNIIQVQPEILPTVAERKTAVESPVPPPPMPQQVAFPRKGKGSGVKDLAAMRARSITKNDEKEDESNKNHVPLTRENGASAAGGDGPLPPPPLPPTASAAPFVSHQQPFVAMAPAPVVPSTAQQTHQTHPEQKAGSSQVKFI